MKRSAKAAPEGIGEIYRDTASRAKPNAEYVFHRRYRIAHSSRIIFFAHSNSQEFRVTMNHTIPILNNQSNHRKHF
jgi:hypothetical protein